MMWPLGIINVSNTWDGKRFIKKQRMGGVCWRWGGVWHSFTFKRYGEVKRYQRDI